MHASNLAYTPLDSTQVTVSNPGDIRFWTRNFGVSEERLRAAVVLVGSLSSDVRAELRRKRLISETLKTLRVFVFYPSINHRNWWVLLPGAAQETFASEGAAVQFALERARDLRGSGRAVEVVQEKITGTWMRVVG
ncbi:hypothetical protein QFZ41_003757 [Luteibacter sp. W1I16]|jgi:hypothetical protein|uniref:DUF3606 domain-containing protein n=1 Tax=Luteibacter sp. W1I16 TaxID=3373922 RepID=UPI003D196C6F